MLGDATAHAESDIRAQYRRLALKWHPDKHGNSDDAKRTFQLIGEAARVLTNPDLRAQYNASAKWDVSCFSVDEYLRRFKDFMLSPQGLRSDEYQLYSHSDEQTMNEDTQSQSLDGDGFIE